MRIFSYLQNSPLSPLAFHFRVAVYLNKQKLEEMKKGNALPFLFPPYLGFFTPAHLGAPRRSRSSSASRRHQRSPLLFPRGHPAAPPASDPLLPSSSPRSPSLSLTLTKAWPRGHPRLRLPPSYKSAPGPSLGFLLASPFLICAASSLERFPKPSSFSCAPWPPRVQARRWPSSMSPCLFS